MPFLHRRSDRGDMTEIGFDGGGGACQFSRALFKDAMSGIHWRQKRTGDRQLSDEQQMK